MHAACLRGVGVVGIALWAVAACTVRNPAYCEVDEDCEDAAFPVCDVDGTLGGGANSCVAAVDADADAGPDADGDTTPSTRRVTVTRFGFGEGSVASMPLGIACGNTCEHVFEVGATVVLTATPSAGSVFAGWTGSACAGTDPCELGGDADVEVGATFELERYSLTVSLGGDGSGEVTSSPAGISCEPTCAHSYENGTTLTLTASPAAGSSFGGWSGDCAGLDLTCEVTVTKDTVLGAAFDESLVSLSVSVGGTGAGSVVSDVGAIDCPGVCSDSYVVGSTVVLTATPDGSSTFDGWVGGGCSATGSCAVVLSAAAAVVATFTRITHPVSVGITGSGSGSIAASPAGISCPDSCVAVYDQGTVLHLAATPDEHSVFDAWSGACSGPDPDCSITVDGAKTATAAFAPGNWIAAGGNHTCAIQNAGEVRCFGSGVFGQRGDGNGDDFGGDENALLATLLKVSLGGTVTRVATGVYHTCVLLDSGAVRCFGRGAYGRLGYGGVANIGDTELPLSVGPVDVGGDVAEIDAGDGHTCVVMTDRNVRCWGSNAFGQLGLGHEMTVGDDFGETPSDFPVVNVGGPVRDIATGYDHTCALLESGGVVCWGKGAGGRLGYGDTEDIGDTESPADAGLVDIGGTAVQVVAGGTHTCVLLDTGEVRCWGESVVGALGTGTATIGDNELPTSVAVVDVGGPVTQIAAGTNHTCALLVGGFVRCWGAGADGQLGNRSTTNIGDNEAPSSWDVVNVGGTVAQIDAGGAHTCARMATGAFRCWGLGASGQLGYGDTASIGGVDSPASWGDIPIL